MKTPKQAKGRLGSDDKISGGTSSMQLPPWFSLRLPITIPAEALKIYMQIPLAGCSQIDRSHAVEGSVASAEGTETLQGVLSLCG